MILRDTNLVEKKKANAIPNNHHTVLLRQIPLLATRRKVKSDFDTLQTP